MQDEIFSEWLCRACANTVEVARQENAPKELLQLYNKLTELEVSDDDQLPKCLCRHCADLLQTFKTFKETCMKSLDIHLSTLKVKAEPIDIICPVESLESLVKVENNQVVSYFMPEILEDAFDFKKMINVEMKKEPSNRPSCHICNISVATMSSIRRHMKKHITSDLSDSSIKYEPNEVLRNKRLRKKLLKCPYEGCDKICRFPASLIAHKLKHEKMPTRSRCKRCGKEFISIHRYKRHLRRFHDDISDDIEIKDYPCPICSKSFANIYSLKNHIQMLHSETNDKTFICEECGSAFRTNGSLKTHQRSHNNIRPFKCDNCSKTYKTNVELRKHKFRFHEDFVLPQCQICGANVKDLIEHCRNMHTVYTTTERLVRCEICEKGFANMSSLKRHMAIHSGERKYVCQVCSKKFTSASSLKTHTYYHTGERPVHCEICNKGFYKSFALKIHMNIHKRQWIAEGQQGIELLVYPTSNKKKIKLCSDDN